jgi:nicotinamidase-related amidase
MATVFGIAMTSLPRLTRDNAQLLVIDVQERLLPHISGGTELVDRIVCMLAAAGVLDLPVTLVEQYTAGLGNTVADVERSAGRATRFEKVTFSACGDRDTLAHLTNPSRMSVVLVGIETHVCVLKTALDLIGHGLSVFVAADAVGARRDADHRVALRRMRDAGATITTVESAIFEMLDDCRCELFKRILPIVK